MKMKFRTRLRLLVTLSLLLFCLIGFAIGKYIQTFRAEEKVTVTFSNNLADVFEVRESEATRNTTTGAYTLNKSKPVTDEQTYVLIPGVDIEKDPYVFIDGRSEIPAELYIEIVDTLDEDGIRLVTYAVRSDLWEVNTTYKPDSTGTVYKYKGTVTNGGYPYYAILANDTVTVSQHVKGKSKDDGKDVLTIYAYLEEIPPSP